jgi:murein DD-endopeptidase MepM/ murein hydrolase activator NlpD
MQNRNSKHDINFVIVEDLTKPKKSPSDLQISLSKNFNNTLVLIWYAISSFFIFGIYNTTRLVRFCLHFVYQIGNVVADTSDAMIDSEARRLFLFEIRVWYKINISKLKNNVEVFWFFTKKLYLFITVFVLLFSLKIAGSSISPSATQKSFINQAFDNYSFLNSEANVSPSNATSITTTNKQIVDIFPLNKIIVKPEDKLAKIAENQNLNLDSILLNNNIEEGKPLPKELIVPWQDGYIYFPKVETSPKDLADKYKIDEKIIYESNEDKLNDKGKFAKDATIIIPVKDFTNIKKTIAKDKELLQKEEQFKQIKENQSKLAKSYQDQFTDNGSMGTKFANSTSEEKRSAGLIWPTKGSISRCIEPGHPGCDIANPAMPPVYAVADGVVIDVYRFTVYGYGNAVVIDHGNGLTSLSAHLNEIYVTKGQSVSQGQSIGQMGNTGNSTGTHLHIEIKQNKIAQNPLAYFP